MISCFSLYRFFCWPNYSCFEFGCLLDLYTIPPLSLPHSLNLNVTPLLNLHLRDSEPSKVNRLVDWDSVSDTLARVTNQLGSVTIDLFGVP